MLGVHNGGDTQKACRCTAVEQCGDLMGMNSIGPEFCQGFPRPQDHFRSDTRRTTECNELCPHGLDPWGQCSGAIEANHRNTLAEFLTFSNLVHHVAFEPTNVQRKDDMRDMQSLGLMRTT